MKSKTNKRKSAEKVELYHLILKMGDQFNQATLNSNKNLWGVIRETHSLISSMVDFVMVAANTYSISRKVECLNEVFTLVYRVEAKFDYLQRCKGITPGQLGVLAGLLLDVKLQSDSWLAGMRRKLQGLRELPESESLVTAPKE